MTRPRFDLSRIIAAAMLALCSGICLGQDLPDVAPGLLPEDAVPEEEIRRYSVEIIVFRYASHVADGNELFAPEVPPEPAVPEDQDFGDDGAPVEYGDFVEMPAASEDPEPEVEIEEVLSLTTLGFHLLQPDEMTMTGIHEKLVKLDAYQPVLWGGWSQVVVDQSLTPAVRLRMLGSPPLDIDGALTLYLKNYLHLVVDLAMEERSAAIEPVYRQEDRRNKVSGRDSGFAYNTYDYQTIRYLIDEDRIFRSGELRYYDHPKFGVLARVMRVEEADGTEDDDPATGPSMLGLSGSL